MSDLISRQALRDAMYHEAFETDTEMQRWDSGCWIRYKMFENVIDHLPSAEVGTQMSSADCISRQDAIGAIVAWTVEDRPDIEMPTDLIDRVNALPSAQLSPCDVCRYYPPSAMDGKACTLCVAEGRD